MTGPDSIIQGLLRRIAEKPLDRAPWLAASDRAQEIEKPWLAALMRYFGRMPNPTKSNSTIHRGVFRHDPYKILDTTFRDSPHDRLYGDLAGVPTVIQAHPSGPYMVRHSALPGDWPRIASASVPPHMGTGLVHELTDVFPPSAHEAEKQRVPYPGHPEEHGIRLNRLGVVLASLRSKLHRTTTQPESYEKSYETVTNLLGHDPDGIPVWTALHHTILPHSSGDDAIRDAALLTAHWLANKKPRDPFTLDRMLRTSNVPAATLHHAKLSSVLQTLGKEKDNAPGRPPEHNPLYTSPGAGSPLTTYTSRGLFNPDYVEYKKQSPLLRQVHAHLVSPDAVEQHLKSVPLKSELVRFLKNSPGEGVSIPSVLESTNKHLHSDPQTAMLFKNAVYDAAHKLDWHPDHVQESVWSLMTALAAHHKLNTPPATLAHKLSQDSADHGEQNNESRYFPQLADWSRKGRTDPFTLRRMADAAKTRATSASRSGVLRSSDATDYASVDSVLPGSGSRDASSLIKDRLTKHLKSLGVFDGRTGKFRMSRWGKKLYLSWSNQLGLLKSVIDTYAPGKQDAAPGKVYADWLDEHGFPLNAELYRNDFGNPMAGITRDPHDNNEWIRLMNGMRELGKEGTAEAIEGLITHGRNAGGPLSRQAGEREFAKQRWLSGGIPHGSQLAWINRPEPQGEYPFKSTYLHVNGIPIVLHPYLDTDATGNQTPTYFAHMVFTHRRPGLSPEEPLAGTFLRPEVAHKIMNEADHFSEPTDAKNAAEFTGNPKLATKLQRVNSTNYPLHLGQYDAALPFGPAQDRATAVNQQVLSEHLRQILHRAGIEPHEVVPAIHDFNGAARTSVLATGRFLNPRAPQLGAAWTGLLGRQPGMLAFHSDPRGQDAVYHFKHGNAAAVQQALTNAGVANRVLVPAQTHYNVYVFDRGGKLRSQVGNALTQLGVTANEWRGQGHIVGGDQDDMGRAQYRQEINRGEAQQLARPLNDLGQGLFRAIQHKPIDAAPWLIAADWHEEQGRHLFASVLRMLGKGRDTYYSSAGFRLPNRDVYKTASDASLQGHFRVPSVFDVSRVYGKVGGIHIMSHLKHATPDMDIVRRGLTSSDPVTPYGQLAITTSHGRPLGDAQIPLDTFAGVLGEGNPPTPRSMPGGREAWVHLLDTIKKRQTGVLAAEPGTTGSSYLQVVQRS